MSGRTKRISPVKKFGPGGENCPGSRGPGVQRSIPEFKTGIGLREGPVGLPGREETGGIVEMRLLTPTDITIRIMSGGFIRWCILLFCCPCFAEEHVEFRQLNFRILDEGVPPMSMVIENDKARKVLTEYTGLLAVVELKDVKDIGHVGFSFSMNGKEITGHRFVSGELVHKVVKELSNVRNYGEGIGVQHLKGKRDYVVGFELTSLSLFLRLCVDSEIRYGYYYSPEGGSSRVFVLSEDLREVLREVVGVREE